MLSIRYLTKYCQSIGIPTIHSALLAGIVTGLYTASAVGDTIVQLQTEYDDYQVSEGYLADIDSVFNTIDQARNTSAADSVTGIATSVSADSAASLRHRWHSHDIQVTDVGSSVYSDADNDGFFTHFSLSFDVDTDYGDEWVYAKIYLRTDDSEYALFHTTEVFEIYDSLEADRYQLDSKLVANYAAAFYDIRIEIYESSSDALYDTVDASTHRTLFALPLEADIVDDGPQDNIVHGHAGSLGLQSLLVFALLGCLRRKLTC